MFSRTCFLLVSGPANRLVTNASDRTLRLFNPLPRVQAESFLSRNLSQRVSEVQRLGPDQQDDAAVARPDTGGCLSIWVISNEGQSASALDASACVTRILSGIHCIFIIMTLPYPERCGAFAEGFDENDEFDIVSSVLLCF